MSVDKILSMVDVAGSPDKFNKYQAVVQKLVPSDTDKSRYWTMYAQVAQSFIDNPKVTDKKSVLTCMFNAVKFGLNPDPALGLIYFIPYKGVLTYQLGYKGMIKLSYNTGKVRDIRTGQIFTTDTYFYYEDEKGQHFRFEPNLTITENKKGKEVFAYSIFEKNDGAISCHVMESTHIDKIKDMVLKRSPDAQTWKNPVFEPEMRKKTALRRHWKTQPMSPELADAIEQEEAAERGEIIQKPHAELTDIIDPPTPPATTTPEASKGKKKPDPAPAAPPEEEAPQVSDNGQNVDFFR